MSHEITVLSDDSLFTFGTVDVLWKKATLKLGLFSEELLQGTIVVSLGAMSLDFDLHAIVCQGSKY